MSEPRTPDAAFQHPLDPACDGSQECKALIHLHGCFSEKRTAARGQDRRKEISGQLRTSGGASDDSGYTPSAAYPLPCGCSTRCGDDGDVDGPGTCKGLPLPPREPLVEIVLIDKRTGEVV